MSNHFLSQISQKAKSKPTSQLAILWQRIEKHQKRNSNYERRKQQLFNQFQEQILPHEHHQAQLMVEQIIHLSKFIPRKSLTVEERNELVDWINDDLDYLSASPFSGDANINKATEVFHSFLDEHNNKAIDDIPEEQIDIFRNMILQDFPELTLTDEQVKQIALNPEVIHEIVAEQAVEEDNTEQLESEFDEEADWDDFFDQFQDDSYFERDELNKESMTQLEQFFKGSQLNKMYKRLASKLHPDKEQDNAKKAEKHEQMQLLAKARKEKDGFTLLQMYMDNFDDVELDAASKENLVPLLEYKIAQLNSEYRNQKHNNEPATLVWHKFNDRNKTLTQQNLDQHETNLHFECDELRHRIQTLSTVKSLKVELKQRLEARKIMPVSIHDFFDNMFDL